MSKTITIDIDRNLYPKLFDDDIDIEKLKNYIFNIGYQSVFSSIADKNVITNIDNICRRNKDDITSNLNYNNQLIIQNINQLNMKDKFDQLNQIIHKLFGEASNSYNRGEISENLIYKIINEKYPNYTYEVKRNIAHNGDGELNSPSGLKALFEIKNYTSVVQNKEIDKFKYDLKFNKIYYGLFISLQTGISGKKLIDYETFNDGGDDYHIVYISKVIDDMNRLDSSIILLENIFSISNKNNINIKIDHIKRVIYENFNNLDKIISKTDNLRGSYSKIENTIKSNLDDFYIILRDYECELRQQMQKTWLNLFSDLEDIEDKKYIDENLKILDKLSKKDKCYNIMCKLFDILKKNEVNILEKEKNKSDLIFKKENIGHIKKMKDKVQLYIKNVTITFSLKDKNVDDNYKLIDILLK